MVDCLRIAGRCGVLSLDCPGILPHGLGSRLEQQLLESGDLLVLAIDDDCLRRRALLLGLVSLSWLRSGDKCDLESRLPLEALSGLKLSLLARRSFSSPSGLSAGCDSLRVPQPPGGKQDSS